MKRPAFIALFVLAVAGAFGAYSLSQSIELAPDNTKSTIRQSLTIIAQDAKQSVHIDSIIIPTDGYVVIRGIEGTRLGQIIEISELLSAGEHADITIDLGDFYDGTQELVAMIYGENGDRVFNDNDKPLKMADGSYTARYVRTGAAVSTEILSTASTVTGGHVMGSGPMIQVRYTDTGFEPASLKVVAGTMVEFVNESSKDMWVASNEHPEHGILPTFDEFESVAKGGTYTYVFDKKGSWAYHDHINPATEGVIIVK